jgi:hypothetical protein
MDGYKQHIPHKFRQSLILLSLGFGLQWAATPALPQLPNPQETLLGIIMAVDEAKDRITMKADSGIDSTFKVQDGLIFNAIHRGDRVEVTVANIGGTKTIIGLKKIRE